MTLTEFLLARIAEDEECARDGLTEPTYDMATTAADEVLVMADHEGLNGAGNSHFRQWMPARVLAECEAKRRIVELHNLEPRTLYHDLEDDEQTTGCAYCMGWGDSRSSDDNEPACPTLRFVALPYADHPDYQPEWSVS